MSLINKMLQELDKRHAAQGAGAGHAGGLAQHVRPITPKKIIGSDFFWRVMALIMLIAVGWVAWVVWQMLPHPLITELTEQTARERASAPKAVVTEQTIPAPQAAVTSPAPAPVSVPAQQPAVEPANPDMLRLATELTTPIPARRAKPSASKPGPRKPVVLASAPPAPGNIDRHVNSSSHQGAENEFRRAVGLVNQGRIAEGMDGFRNALKLDPEHQAARQTLVALLLEAKRVNEASTVIEEGLALNPANAGYAMLLARIKVERNDVPGALALLQKHATSGGTSPDYHAFTAALYQRLNRHQEAIEEYRTALGLAPLAGVWWVGLGISYQAVERPKDAFEAFNRARATGNLAPDLIGFVDQRLKQLKLQ